MLLIEYIRTFPGIQFCRGNNDCHWRVISEQSTSPADSRPYLGRRHVGIAGRIRSKPDQCLTHANTRLGTRLICVWIAFIFTMPYLTIYKSSRWKPIQQCFIPLLRTGRGSRRNTQGADCGGNRAHDKLGKRLIERKVVSI